jgi:hypothetical protein
MLDNGIGFFVITAVGLFAILLALFVFASLMEGWPRWTDEWRIRKHFEH